jgi:hypothetical protein
MKEVVINKYVLVRSDDSGVHFGTCAAWEGSTVLLHNSRRLWEWDTGGTGISLSEVAICGIAAAKSKITMTLPEIIILGVCEIIPCHGMAVATITGAAVYTPP